MAKKTSPSKLDLYLFCFSASWFCMESGVAVQEQATTVCCVSNHTGTHPKSCGTCGFGKCCADRKCNQCRPIPQCQEGEQLSCSGTFDFRYSCKPCPDGSYSSNNNSCCIPWTNCKKLRLQILHPGNRTHNVQCSQEPETDAVQPGCGTAAESIVTTVLTTMTAVGVFVLVLLTCILIICTWRQKKEQFPLVEDPEDTDTDQWKPLEVKLSQEAINSSQFSEEGEGDKVVGA